MNTTLQFAKGNAKLDKLAAKMGPVYSFSLLSGHTCPYAKDCQSRAIETPDGRRILDGPHTLFRCFSASQEVLYTPVYNARKRNTDLIRDTLAVAGKSGLVKLLRDSIPAKARVVRIHVGGDFMLQDYFDAWLAVAELDASRIYYAYTKALPFWVRRINDIPKNMVLTASYGGYRDDLIAKYDLRYTKVVKSKYAARKLHLPIDHDDTHAANPDKRAVNFALLLHGPQPKGHKRAKYGYRR